MINAYAKDNIVSSFIIPEFQFSEYNDKPDIKE